MASDRPLQNYIVPFSSVFFVSFYTRDSILSSFPPIRVLGRNLNGRTIISKVFKMVLKQYAFLKS